MLFSSLEASYTVQEVPIFYDYFMNYTTSLGGHTLKDDGSVIGEAAFNDDERYYDIFCWTPDNETFSLEEIIRPLGHKTVYATDRNLKGQIAGILYKNYEYTPFLWCPLEGMQFISDEDLTPFKINSAGQIALRRNNDNQYFLWEKESGLIPVEWPDHLNITQPTAISFNDKGQILFIDKFSREIHPLNSSKTTLIWEKGEDPIVIQNSSANCINNLGDAVGTSLGKKCLQFPGQVCKGFIQFHDGQTMTVDSNKAQVYFESINDNRQVVGWKYESKTAAIIWDSKNGVRDLNKLITGKAPKHRLTQAISINNQGQILAIGVGDYGMSNNLYLLTPG